jgi:predicted methyltransferase
VRRVGDAHDLNWIADGSYDLVVLDPPYSDEESEMLYATPPLKYGRFVSEAVRVCKPGGHVAIYHVKQTPRPEGTRLVRRIVVLTRTWHAARICMVFQKSGGPGEQMRLAA